MRQVFKSTACRKSSPWLGGRPAQRIGKTCLKWLAGLRLLEVVTGITTLLAIMAPAPGNAQNTGGGPLFGAHSVIPFDLGKGCVQYLELATFEQCLKDAGANKAALAAARALSGEGGTAFLSEYRSLGRVDVAEVVSRSAANFAFYGFVIDGQKYISAGFDRMAVKDRTSRNLKQHYPNAVSYSPTWIVGHRYLENGGQRFILTAAITDGCRACDVIATSIGYVDFRNGRKVNSGTIGWAPQRGGFPTSYDVVRRRLYGQDTREFQTQLNLRGYIAGSMDGVYGSATARAIGQFAAAHCIDGGDQAVQEIIRVLGSRKTPFEPAPCGPGRAAPAPGPYARGDSGSYPGGSLPLREGVYATKAEYCAAPYAQLSVAEDAGEFRRLYERNILHYYESLCGVVEHSRTGDRIAAKLACEGEGQTWERTGHFVIRSNTQFIENDTEFTHCDVLTTPSAPPTNENQNAWGNTDLTIKNIGPDIFNVFQFLMSDQCAGRECQYYNQRDQPLCENKCSIAGVEDTYTAQPVEGDVARALMGRSGEQMRMTSRQGVPYAAKGDLALERVSKAPAYRVFREEECQGNTCQSLLVLLFNEGEGFVIEVAAGLQDEQISSSDSGEPETPGFQPLVHSEHLIPPISPFSIAAGFLDPVYAGRHGKQLVGVELDAPVGATVRAPISGTVSHNRTGQDFPAGQKWLALRNPKTGHEHVFGHLHSQLEEGRKVEAGQTLGQVTDGLEGKRLHWGINRFGIRQAVDVESGWGWGYAPDDTDREEIMARGWTDPDELLGSAKPENQATPASVAPEINEQALQNELSRFDRNLANMSTAANFFGELKTLYDIAKDLKDLRHARRLLESILTPKLAAEASMEAATTSAGLSIGGFTTKYLVKHAYAKDAPFTRFLSEDVALTLTDAMFNIAAGVATGGVKPLISQSISTTSNIIDSVIAYRQLGQDTERLVEDTLKHARDNLRYHQDGNLSEDQALAHFEMMQELADNLLGRVPVLTWAPSREASYKLEIISKLGRIKIEQGPIGMSLLHTDEVRSTIRRMDTWDKPMTNVFKGPVFQIFADEVATQFDILNWEPFIARPDESSLDTGREADADFVSDLGTDKADSEADDFNSSSGMSKEDFERISAYLHEIHTVADGLDEMLEPGLSNVSIQHGIPRWEIFGMFLAAEDVARNLVSEEYADAARSAATFAFLKTAARNPRLSDLLGVVKIARLAALPIDLSLKSFIKAVDHEGTRRQVEAYFIARRPPYNLSHDDILNRRRPEADLGVLSPEVLFSDGGWFYIVDGETVARPYKPLTSARLTPREVFTAAKIVFEAKHEREARRKRRDRTVRAFMAELREMKATSTPALSRDQARDHAVNILKGYPYGRTRAEVLSNITSIRFGKQEVCGDTAAWIFDVHVSDPVNDPDQPINGYLVLDADDGTIECAGLPFLR